MNIYYATSYRKAFKKYAQFNKLVDTKIQIFKDNPFDSGLRTHKLSGSLDGYYSFSVNFSFRILFRFIDPRTVLFIDIGTHGIYH